MWGLVETMQATMTLISEGKIGQIRKIAIITLTKEPKPFYPTFGYSFRIRHLLRLLRPGRGRNQEEGEDDEAHLWY